ncbi:MAG: phosphatase PAP2 family protein [Spirochaetia bacterium]|nr:phosphatase PAP2 family protein [Spirochaetia bacterium]
MRDERLIKIAWFTGLLFVLTVPFRVFPLDLKIQSLLYDASAHKWIFTDNLFFRWIYTYGTIPALILSAGALIILIAGYIGPKFSKYRRSAAIIVLAMALGPGLLVNVVLKNYMGRPRPREVKEFGGRWDFKYPLQPGVPGKGHSFPCGHCTMGFGFYSLYVVLRRNNRPAAFTALSGGAAYGVTLGIARMAQGAHFASDVLWAGGITMLSAEAAAFAVDTIKTRGWFEKHKGTTLIAGTGILGLTVIFFLLATPFHKYREYYPEASQGKFSLETSGASVIITQAPAGAGPCIVMEVLGFGFPWADFNDIVNPQGKYGYSAFRKGFFMELNASIRVSLPSTQGFIINAGTGDIDFSAHTRGGEVVLFSSSGDITFSPSPGSSIKDAYLKTKKGSITLNLGKEITLEKGASLNLSAGRVVKITNSSVYFGELSAQAGRVNGARELFVKPRFTDGPELTVTGSKILINNE